MFSGSGNAKAQDGASNYCDAEGAGTTQMISTYKGDEYNHQFLMALSGTAGNRPAAGAREPPCAKESRRPGSASAKNEPHRGRR